MIDPHFQNGQMWCLSLRNLMGYPLYPPSNHTMAWCTSGRRNLLEAAHLAKVAEDAGKDLVHLAFDADLGDPVAVSLMVRGDVTAQWIENCQLYCASETAPIELLSGEKRWFVGRRQVLTCAKLPPKSRRARGEAIAWRRWKALAPQMVDIELSGSVWVPAGAPLAAAIPHDRIKVAA